jgi:protein gp37
MTALPIILETPQAKIDVDALKGPIVNTGQQATWLKNPDGITQGPGWPLVTCGPGCNVSEGCQLCLWEAEKALAKKEGRKLPKVRALVENLDHPFRWKKPKNVFVCPQGDIFHKNIPRDFILQALDVMKRCPQHNFIMPTKRDYRLKELKGVRGIGNVYVGVSVESQEYMYRAEALLGLPKGFRKVLFVAPMLTPVVVPWEVLRVLDWVICSPERGGEGRTPRPCPEEWQMDLIRQVKSYDLPFFLDVKFQEERVFRMGGKFMEVPAALMN